MHVHGIAGLRPQEQQRPTQRHGFTGAFEGQPIGHRAGQHGRNVAKLVAAADLVPQGLNGRGFIVAGVFPQIAAEQAVFVDEVIHIGHVRRGRRTVHIAHGRANKIFGIIPAKQVEGARGEDREEEIVVIHAIFRNRRLQDLIQHAHRRPLLQQVEEKVITGVKLAAADVVLHQLEGFLHIVIDRLGLGVRQNKRAHNRGVNVFVGQGDMLHDRHMRIITGQSRRGVIHRVQPGDRVQRTTVVARGQIGRANHR